MSKDLDYVKLGTGVLGIAEGAITIGRLTNYTRPDATVIGLTGSHIAPGAFNCRVFSS